MNFLSSKLWNLIVCAENIVVGENGKFASTGKPVNGTCWSHTTAGSGSGPYYSGAAGGGSGGGSINIFYKKTAEGFTTSKFEISASYSPNGTYNVGSIETGTYVKLLPW